MALNTPLKTGLLTNFHRNSFTELHIKAKTSLKILKYDKIIVFMDSYIVVDF